MLLTGNRRVCIWSKEVSFQRDFKTKYAPTCIAATGDNHLLITSLASHTSSVMVYMLGGQLVYEFGRKGSDPGRFSVPSGICVDDSGAVYVADYVTNVCSFSNLFYFRLKLFVALLIISNIMSACVIGIVGNDGFDC